MMMNRRVFTKLLGAGTAALATGWLISETAAQTPEPKSIHTWLDSDKKQIYAYDIDVKISDFPKNGDRSWLWG
jgi:hypothetical protein